MKLIKKFNSCEKINVYFETSISAGIYINEYINGKEIFPIKDFLEDYKGTMFGTREFQNFIIYLKRYNQRAKRKINFYGVDLEFQKHITEKILEYVPREYKNTWRNRIVKNQTNTLKINSLDEKNFEIQRENILVNNFLEIYEPNSICYMGAWHVRNDSYDDNFVKKIKSKNISLLSIEIIYQNSKMTIKANNEFKIVKVNDDFDKKQYQKYGDFYIMKNDSNQGIMPLENCVNTEMISLTKE